jgi:hypothetical protein
LPPSCGSFHAHGQVGCVKFERSRRGIEAYTSRSFEAHDQTFGNQPLRGFVTPARGAVRVLREELILELPDLGSELKGAVSIDAVLLRESPSFGGGDFTAGHSQLPLPVFRGGIGEADDDSELGYVFLRRGRLRLNLGGPQH